MRLVVLCLVAWLVLAVAALASGGAPDRHSGDSSHSILPR